MTPAQRFHHLLTCDQAERDAAPCAEPMPGHIGLMRHGMAVFLISSTDREGVIYQPAGSYGWDNKGRILFRPWPIDECQSELIATLDLTATLSRLIELETQ
jgi:hypothetical protein